MSAHVYDELELASDQRLSRAERERVDAHLAQCGECRSYAADIRRNDELLARHDRFVDPPPFGAAVRRTRIAWAPLLAAAASAIIVITALGVASENVSRPQTSLLPTAAPGVGGSSSPVVSTSTPPSSLPPGRLAPFSGQASSVSGLRTNALGDLRGNWIFIGRWVQLPQSARVQVELWAVPLLGGAPRPVLAYEASIGGIPEAVLDNAPYLRRQFSPDGKQLAISIDAQIVTVDLATGQAHRIGGAGYYPSWSRLSGGDPGSQWSGDAGSRDSGHLRYRRCGPGSTEYRREQERRRVVVRRQSAACRVGRWDHDH